MQVSALIRALVAAAVVVVALKAVVAAVGIEAEVAAVEASPVRPRQLEPWRRALAAVAKVLLPESPAMINCEIRLLDGS